MVKSAKRETLNSPALLLILLSAPRVPDGRQGLLLSYALSRHGGFITIDIEAESAMLIEGAAPASDAGPRRGPSLPAQPVIRRRPGSETIMAVAPLQPLKRARTGWSTRLDEAGLVGENHGLYPVA